MREWHQAESTSLNHEPAGLYPPCLAHRGKLNNGSNKALILSLPLQSHFDTNPQSDVLRKCAALISRGHAKRMEKWTNILQFYYQLDLNRSRNHMEEEDPKYFT